MRNGIDIYIYILFIILGIVPLLNTHTQLYDLASLTKWSSVCLTTRFSWVRVPLQSLIFTEA